MTSMRKALDRSWEGDGRGILAIMAWLLTWPTYGHWLDGPARGWVDRGVRQESDELPVPEERLTVERAAGLTWPSVGLTSDQAETVLAEIGRIAAYRRFTPMVGSVGTTFVRLMLEADSGWMQPRLVQLIKGSTSRALTVATGDEAARSASGAPLRHRKWWARQFSLRLVHHDLVDAITACIRAEAECGGMARVRWGASPS